MNQGRLTFEAARESRFALVEKGYQEFRKKWNVATPEAWVDGQHEFHFRDHARSQAGLIPLKYDFPASVLDNLEVY
jgi:hypothetical protein